MKKKKIGILLSGGLDSRIVAGLIKEIQNEYNNAFEVTAFTWGHENSRDFIYAKEICKRFNWNFKHVEVTVEDFKENFYIAAKNGAEFSPLHLHSIPRLNLDNEVECVIAGSYGDSVGRAEFSGVKVEFLKPIINGNLNNYGLFNRKLISKYKSKVFEDAYEYRKIHKRDKEYQYYEIEQELHYMRRKLNACMNINKNLRIEQAFTHPSVFGYMWSLDPQIRTDKIYESILKTLPNQIGLIPWARNGKILGREKDEIQVDDYTNIQYKYSVWLRNDLKEFVLNKLNNFDFERGNIFNKAAIEHLIKVWLKGTTNSVSQIDEIITWLVTFIIYVEEYNLKFELEDSKADMLDQGHIILGRAKLELYQVLRNKARK